MKSKISVLFLFVSLVCSAQNGLHIVFSDNTSLIFEYTPVITDSGFININNENFLNVNLADGFRSKTSEGIAVIPAFTFPLGVPSETGNTIELLNSEFSEINGKLTPYPQLIKDNGLVSEKYDISQDYYSFNSFESDIVTFGDYGLLRGLPVQSILIKPVQFNASESRIRIYKKIRCRINFAPANVNTVYKLDRLLANSVVNYKVAATWKVSEKTLKKEIFNSVLSTGKWFRFEAPEEGIYKITKSMLASYGIDANTVDPKTIKIYNNGGKVLPESINLPAPGDLVENAVFVSGEGDGVFNDDDYILFYGRGVNFWEYDTLQGRHMRRSNPYSLSNYFWITSGGGNGKRTAEKVNLQGTSNYLVNSTPAFVHWDEDKINIAKSGRYLMGDEFTPSMRSRTYINKLDQLIPNSVIRYSFQFINSDFYDRTLRIEDNSTLIFNRLISGRRVDSNSDFSAGFATFASSSAATSLIDDRSTLKFNFDAQGDKSFGYLDFFEIAYNKFLVPTGDQLLFYSPDTTTSVEYYLAGFSNSNITVFDITDYANVKVISNPFISGGEFRFASYEESRKVSKYLAIGNNTFKSPINPVEISNSNIHGEQTGASLIIVTSKDFVDQAQRLKVHHETDSPVLTSSYVVQIGQVFNEFSGGMSDISGLRNFIKYAFENWTVKPEYVLLFGDATYDYRNIEGQGGNFVLTFETENSVHLLNSYPMDDYFVKVSGNDSFLDLAVGRINAVSLPDAKAAVDKIIFYETSSEKGDWQNTVSLVADDNITSQGNEGNYHTPQSEGIAKLLPGFFLKNKIYLGAYPTIITGFGRTKPGVSESIINSVNKGTLILNYIGHGSPELWSHERVFEKSSTIPQFRNDKYFFLTAATCDFGYYDIPSVQSGAEVLVLKPDGGAIGAFTASRPVFSNENDAINRAFYTNLLLSARDTMNFPITVGEAYFKTKRTMISDNDNKFLLFGDPSVRLLIPRYYSFVDSINGLPISTNDIQIQALSNSRVSGHIGKDSLPWSEYNGEGILSIYDSERDVPLPQLQAGYNVKVDGGVIFKGRVSITNGTFSSYFTVPKDISYENSRGKIIFFYSNDNGNGIGFTNNFNVGGTDSSSINDNKGPEIEVYFDDAANKNAYLINLDSRLIIHLTDDTGLNTTGTGVGHKLEGVLNDDINNPIDFTSYFTGDLDAGGKSGTVNYKINTFQEGKYKLQVKAWDVFNNFSTETIYFNVVSGDDLEVSNVVNYPNPFSGSTTFTLQQNLSGSLDISIKIYTVAGRLIKNINRPSIQDRFVKIDWDGKDEDGNQIANGTYFYKVILRSTDGQFNKSVLGKLAVIR